MLGAQAAVADLSTPRMSSPRYLDGPHVAQARRVRAGHPTQHLDVRSVESYEPSHERRNHRGSIFPGLDEEQQVRLLAALVPRFVGESIGSEMELITNEAPFKPISLVEWAPRVGSGGETSARRPSHSIPIDDVTPMLPWGIPATAARNPANGPASSGGTTNSRSSTPTTSSPEMSARAFTETTAVTVAESDSSVASSVASRETVELGFSNGLQGWDVFSVGGSEQAGGSVTPGSALLVEGDSFVVGLQRSFQVPEINPELSFTFTDLEFDTTDPSFINDAFEASLTDSDGNPLVFTIGAGRDAFFNITEGEPAALGSKTQFDAGAISTVTVDLSDVPLGTEANLRLRLVNNDADTETTVRILDVLLPGTEDASPELTIGLLNDTSPDGPGTDAFKADLLTNDPRVKGTVSDDEAITMLEAKVGTGPYQDITSSIDSETYLFYPGLLPAGQHTVAIRATDDAGQTTEESLTFTVNEPPTPVVTGNGPINEGGSINLDASNSFDTEAMIFSYRWDFEDGSSAQGPIASKGFAQDGRFAATLTIIDTAGSTVQDDVAIEVLNVAPKIEPLPDLQVIAGQELAVETRFADDGIFDTHTATIDWGDGTDVDVVVPATSPILSTHTFAEDGEYGVTVSVTDDAGASASRSFTVVVNEPPTKFFVVDRDADEIFRYEATGSPNGSTYLTKSNNNPRGATTTASGELVWVVDTNKGVFAYDELGKASHSWWAFSASNPKGIATDGKDIWIVDAARDRVLHYEDGTEQSRRRRFRWPSSTFELHQDNTDPTGLTTDGETFWVTDARADAVFVYGEQGLYLGQWQLDPENSEPTGITNEPGGGDDLWVVDGKDHLVYRYESALLLRDGSLNASSTFELDSRNTRPEGIADPPVELTVLEPIDDAKFISGSTVLITGSALPDDSPIPVATVTVNGQPVDRLDASGNFFEALDVLPGDNVVDVTAVNLDGETESTSLMFNGVTTSSKAALDAISGRSNETLGRYGITSFDAASQILFTDLAITNGGTDAIETPFIVGITNLTDPTVQVRQPDGVTESGIPCFDFSSLVDAGGLPPNDTSGSRTIRFANPNQRQFSYELVLFGEGNTTPHITSVPNIDAIAQEAYQYEVEATDLDADVLTYSLLAGPPAMGINSETGEIDWLPSTSDVGTHTVLVQVDDARGGRDQQQFTLETTITPPNRPPKFTSAPVTEATLGRQLPTKPLAENEFNGYVATDILLFSDPSFDPSESVNDALLGAPDGLFRDLDGGGVTFGMSAEPVLFDYEASIPLGTDLILSDAAIGDEEPMVTFGYGIPEDSNAGTATNFSGEASFVDRKRIGRPSWSQVNFDMVLFFYDLGPGFGGVTDDFFVSVDDPSDFDMDSVHLLATAELTYQYEIEAVDPDFDPVELNLRSGPDGMALDRLGILRWAPTDAQVGLHHVVIEASDGRGGVATQSFVVAVLPDSTNNPPTIVSEPLPSAVVGELYTSRIVAIDPDEDPLSFELLDGPGDMAIDAETGVLTWTPSLPDIDIERNVTVQVSDRRGGIDTQFFQVLVSAAGIGEIRGEKFGDANGSGQRDALESGLPGWTIYVDDNNNQFRDHGERYAVTDAGGQYALTGLPTGDYVVREQPQPGWVATTNEGTLGYTVSLGADETVEGVDFGNRQLDPTSQNANPFFQGFPPSNARIGERFTYQVLAADAENDPLTYELVLKPDGMAIDGASGYVAWTPGSRQFGPIDVIVRVSDDRDGFALQPFTIDVSSPNSAPFITSTPPGPATHGLPYVYPVRAQDADSEALTFELASAPAGMSISPDGRVEWDDPTFGVQPVEIVVRDGAGDEARQTFELEVLASNSNVLPIITSDPTVQATAGFTYLYRIEATDSNGDPLAFSLDVAPAGMTLGLADPASGINDAANVIRWTPTTLQSDDSPHDVHILVSDGRDAPVEQSFAIEIVTQRANQPPQVVSTPPVGAAVGQVYAYDLVASDPDGGTLTYELTKSPPGMSIDAVTGELRWRPRSEQAGEVDVDVRVFDTQGGSASQQFLLQVKASNSPPQFNRDPLTFALVDEPYFYEIDASDPEGTRLQFSLDQASLDRGMTIDPFAGFIQWIPSADDVGDNRVIIMVEDAFDGIATQEYDLIVFSPTAPDTPAEIVNRPPAITSTPPILGTVGESYRYTVEAVDEDGDALLIDLTAAPLGATFDPASGLLSWTPNDSDLGAQEFTVRVRDDRGGFGLQAFTVFVLATNSPLRYCRRRSRT